mmetsp:Transcript_10476/g.18922  ORF Transcript_10476/g.18922 Transcript_10476/m.18922 type:complete len:261 (+) Transcript_10476:84-866(+)
MAAAAEVPMNWSTPLLTKGVSTEIRMGFVRKVYALVTCQLLATFILAAPIAAMGPFWAMQCHWLSYVGFGLYLGTVLVASWWRNMLRTTPWNYIALFAITVSMSIMIGLTSAMYTWESVLLAAGLTSLIFMSLTVIAWKTSTDFTGWAPYLYGAGLLFFFFALAVMSLSMFGVRVDMLVTFLDFCGAAFFVIFIIVDTQMILGEWGGHKLQFQVDDYCLGALQLYLDFGDMFLYILKLVGVQAPGVDLACSDKKKKDKET